jgi:hypothetical protein
VVEPALAAARGELRPAQYLYPGGPAYSIAAVYVALDAAGAGGEAGFRPERPTADHYVVARLVVFATSLATLAVTALIGRTLLGPWAGLAAAALLACSPLFAGMSYIATVNPPASLFTALAILFAARVLVRGRRPRDYLASGICAGFAIGCKYNSYAAALPLLVAHLAAPRAPGGVRQRWMLLGWAAVPLAFLATTPFAPTEPRHFLEDVRFLDDVYEREWPLHYNESGSSWGDYAARTWRHGWPGELSLAAAAGALLLARRDGRKALLLAVAPAANFFFLGLYAVFFLRHLLPALPVLAVLSGAVVQFAVEAIDRRRGVAVPGRSLGAAAAALLFVAPLGARSLLASEQRVRRVDLVDTREAAFEWILAHVPEGASIVCEERGPPLAERTGRYRVVHVRSIAIPDQIAEVERHDYAVLTRADDRVILRDPRFAEARALYEAFTARHELAAHFQGRGERYTGRDIRIYRIR